MLLVVQILAALFSFLSIGLVIKNNATRFEKICGSIFAAAYLLIIIYVEVVFKC